MNPIRSLIRFISPAGAQARLTVLIFHRVFPKPDPLFPEEMDADRFCDTIIWLRKFCHIISPDEAVMGLAAGTLPAGAACVTFDDGYADNCTVAVPILERLGVKAAFFIATDFLDGGRMWNDTLIEAVRICSKDKLDLSGIGLGCYDLSDLASRRRAVAEIVLGLKYRIPKERALLVEEVAKLAGGKLPSDLMLSSEQVKEMRRKGMVIGAHTCSHPILANLQQDEVRREILGSKARLEQILQEDIRLFAYPNGKPNSDYRQADAAVVRSLGFDAAFTTAWGVAEPGQDLMQIPRFTPWERSERGFGLRLAVNLAKSRLGRQTGINAA